MVKQCSRRWERRRLIFVVFAAIAAVPGCSRESKYLAVSGTATYDDPAASPLKSGTVTFTAAAGNDFAANTPSGTIVDGKFKIMTGNKDGAPVGKWDVEIKPPPPRDAGTTTLGAPPSDGEPIPPRYSDPLQTPFHVEVKEGMDAKQFDLKVSR